MKAIVQNGYGSPDHLSLKDVDQPVIAEDELLVRVHASSINAGDYFTLKGSPWLVRFSVGFPSPKDHILGWDVAGQVESAGVKVTKFKPGDAVYTACGSAFAEYVKVREARLALMPGNLTFEQAAAVPTGAITALQGLRDAGKVQPGMKVLINGASGGVGIYAVQIAKSLGAEVTGVCSTRNAEMVRSLGADHVIEYTREDFTRGDQKYDVILDNVANHSIFAMRRVLTPDGLIIPNSGHGGMWYVIKAFALSPFMKQLGKMYLADPNQEDLDYLSELIEAGKVRPIIDRAYTMREIPDAFRYLEKTHAQGKIVIRVKEVDQS